MISTRGRYALRALLDIAQNGTDRWVPLKEVANRQSISIKYLEAIMPIFTKAGMVQAVHGKGGGYRLSNEIASYTVYDILIQTEASLAPVACLQCQVEPCQRASNCMTLPLWQHFNEMMETYFKRITLEDVLNGRFPEHAING